MKNKGIQKRIKTVVTVLDYSLPVSIYENDTCEIEFWVTSTEKESPDLQTIRLNLFEGFFEKWLSIKQALAAGDLPEDFKDEICPPSNYCGWIPLMFTLQQLVFDCILKPTFARADVKMWPGGLSPAEFLEPGDIV